MRNYLRFLGRMGLKQPATVAGSFWSWNHYLFLPTMTKRPPPAPVLPCHEIERAVELFYRDGYVVVSDALTPSAATKLKGLVKDKADELLRLERAGLLPRPAAARGVNRYSFGDFGHSPEWEYLAHNERVLPIVKGIWKGLAFRAVAAGGDFVLPGGTWQGLHNDQDWNGAGASLPQVVTVNYYVSDVSSSNGPIRQVPGTARFPVPNHLVDKFEPQWMKESIVTGRPGYAVIRDQRAWHGGTPNTSAETRYMPNLEYVLRDANLEELKDTAIVEQLNRGHWIAEFAAVFLFIRVAERDPQRTVKAFVAEKVGELVEVLEAFAELSGGLAML